MDQRISFITVAVADVERSRRFYIDGLGWQERLHEPGEVLMVAVGPQLVLSLWCRSGFEAEIGPIAGGPGFAPLTLAHNVHSPEEVDQVLAEAVAAGGTLHEAGRAREWGGYTGYVLDPDGFAWEIAHNPGPVGLEVLP